MFLIYSQERPEGLDPTQIDDIKSRHCAVMEEAKETDVLLAVQGLKSTVTATTVPIQDVLDHRAVCQPQVAQAVVQSREGAASRFERTAV